MPALHVLLSKLQTEKRPFVFTALILTRLAFFAISIVQSNISYRCRRSSTNDLTYQNHLSTDYCFRIGMPLLSVTFSISFAMYSPSCSSTLMPRCSTDGSLTGLPDWPWLSVGCSWGVPPSEPEFGWPELLVCCERCGIFSGLRLR